MIFFFTFCSLLHIRKKRNTTKNPLHLSPSFSLLFFFFLSLFFLFSTIDSTNSQQHTSNNILQHSYNHPHLFTIFTLHNNFTQHNFFLSYIILQTIKKHLLRKKSKT
ncbi:hypothetical protein BDA99DRAFT_39011 [Phascolomyces articulosus]|uniref:Uncharacterized protein n=1 Tax=Phascolomyces articulosus TaxID=60185 RepID=A0AAD5KB08_9FUNG|nr:hypothetical protein BDA99DRAFT_39011 [Phascolomyces articulosus]